MSRTVLEVRDLRREVQGRVIITNLSFRVLQGETLFVRGASGVGKSLLLRCLALLDPLQVDAMVPVLLHVAVSLRHFRMPGRCTDRFKC